MSEASVQKLKLLAAKIRATNTTDDEASLKKEDEQPNESQDTQEDPVTEPFVSTDTTSHQSEDTKKKKKKVKTN